MQKFTQTCHNLFRYLNLTNRLSIMAKTKLHKSNTEIPITSSLHKPIISICTSTLHNYKSVPGLLLAAHILTWLGFTSEDEEKESELVMMLKRSVLAMKREQYNLAERFLHLALRLAQQEGNEQGITYCYDLMANLAFDQRDLDKAELMFKSVLQRLLSEGTAQDDLRVVHISLKLARILHWRADMENAEIGYHWCLEQVQTKLQSDFDAKVLYGVVQDWYAQYLLDKGDLERSKQHLKSAYEICAEVKGKYSEEAMMLLNDLGTTSWRAGNLKDAEEYFREAVRISNQLEDQTHSGTVYANMGLIFLEKGIVKTATKYCDKGLTLGRRNENKEAIEQANYCLEQIKSHAVK